MSKKKSDSSPGTQPEISFNTEPADPGRRRLLVGSASVVGGLGAAALVVPMLGSMSPSARAKAAGAPVEADISKLTPGQQLTVEWRGKPVWIVKRTEDVLMRLEADTEALRDPNSEEDMQPNYAQNPQRSIKPEIFVVVGICTHLGCSPTYRPEIAPADLGSDWQGGFFCPCHGSKFDMAGRVVKGVPAPTNLEVPPYNFVNDNLIVVGVDSGAQA
ncbi:MAG: ubiquinol-cytochrome c reductase iron-sulfur subunit [Gammaproteobacteria bacterium]|nr:ubiquinol-cytochrome c reductase iron-sulfur subunit [Gammaproteobacteria bacterium]